MAFIIQQAIGDQRVQLGNEEITRKLAFGNNWTQVRISMRMSIIQPYTPTNGLYTVNPVLAVGLCDGSGPGHSSPETLDWIGIRTNGSWQNDSVSYSGGPVNTWSRKVGQSYVANASWGSRYSYAISHVGHGGSPSGFSIILTRSGSTMTLANYYASSSGVTPVSRLTHLTIAEGAVTQMSSISFTTSTHAIGNVYDTFSLSWSVCVPCLEVADVTIVRLV